METITFTISGMVCGGCANSVRQALLALDGVAQAEVSHVEGSAEVAYDAAKIQPAALRSAIAATGYTVK